MGNAFEKDVTYLKEAYSKVEQVTALESTLSEAKSAAKKYSKMLTTEEKNKKNELESTIKKQRKELESTYDKELESLRSKIKKTDGKREKDKSKQKDERYQLETEQYRIEIKACTKEVKDILRRDHISKLCRRDLYYSLFLPKSMYDFLMIALWLLITIGAVPGAICAIGKFTFMKQIQSPMVYFVLIFVCCASITFITYLVIANKTRSRYHAQLMDCRSEIHKIRAIKKQMKAIRKKIDKDRSETEYDLDRFDEKLTGLNDKMDEIAAAKEAAVTSFEQEKQPMIEQEISKTYNANIEEYAAQLRDATAIVNQSEEQLTELRTDLANNYEAFIGKDYMKPDKLQALIQLMEEQGIATVGEAISAHKSQG